MWLEFLMSTNHSEYSARFVSASIIAARYGVTSRYILQLATAEKIPCLRLGKKCVRFDQDAVAKTIEIESRDGNQISKS